MQNLNKIKSALSVQDDFSHEKLEALYRDLAAKSGISSGKLIHSTRLAVSGISFGPGLFELMQTLGKETVLRRIERAIEFISKSTAQVEKENG